MRLVRIRAVEPLGQFRLRLTLTNGRAVERDVAALLEGPAFEQIRTDPQAFRQVRTENGTVVWADGADLCPDVLIWGGPPPRGEAQPPDSLVIEAPFEPVVPTDPVTTLLDQVRTWTPPPKTRDG